MNLAGYPRLRFMGSKYRLAPRLAELFATLPPGPAVDAFSGSGVVAYTLKASGRSVLANDALTFAATIARATVENDLERIDKTDLGQLLAGNRDGRDFIATTFAGLYFDDHEFLDAVWSQMDTLSQGKRAIAIAAMCLAAAWKQPRGVFTVTTPRYDDGRRQLRAPLRDLFVEAVSVFNRAVFQGAPCRSTCGDVFAIDPEPFAVAYLDPPYAPARDDTDYIKRYHFLEGLATYWEGQEIMWETRTRKLRKRHTPFAYKRSAAGALDRTFEHFRASTIVLSYGSNAALEIGELETLLRRHKRRVDRVEIPHFYGFGTHAKATRRAATEYVLVGA
jgi:DNA adenine methylase/adenine-specific DNA-methyltransferase